MSEYEDTDLKKKEAASVDETPSGDSGGKESSSLAKLGGGSGTETPLFKKLSKGIVGKTGKKWLIGGGVVGGGGLVIGLLLMFVFLSGLKPVHFATVLRSSAFAEFNLVMRERWAQIIFDDAVLADGSAAGASVGKRTMMDRLRGVNPEKQLTTLGQEGKLKFNFEDRRAWNLRKVNEFKGVEIDGKSISLDTIAKEAFPGASDYNSLSIREKATVRGQFVDQVKFGMSDHLALEPRSARNATYKGIRDVTGIKMSRWRQAARDYIGKEPAESYKQARETAYSDAYGERPRSSIDSVDQVLEEEQSQIRQGIETGAELESATITEAAVHARPVGALAKTASTVSTAVILSTVGCMVNDGARAIEDSSIRAQNSAMRIGHQAMTASDQIKKGDTVGEAVSAESKRWDNADQSIDYKMAVGETNALPTANYTDYNVQPKLDNNLLNIVKTVSSPTTYAGIAAPVLSALGIKDNVDAKICGAILNPYSQLGIATIEVVGTAILSVFGGAGAGAEAAAQATTRTIILSLAKTIGKTFLDVLKPQNLAAAGGFVLLDIGIQLAVGLYGASDFTGAETGPSLFTESKIGSDLLAKENSRQGLYGRPLTPEESTQVTLLSKEQERAKFDQGSFSERYLAVSNPYSLVGKIAAVTPSSSSAFTQMIRTHLSSVGTILNPGMGLFHSGSMALLSGNQGIAYAAEASTSDHGVTDWGYSTTELAKIQNDPSYSIESNSAYVEPRLDELNVKYGECFTVKTYHEAEKMRQDPSKHCSASDLATDEAFRFRLYKGLDNYLVGELEADLSSQGDSKTASGAGSINDNVLVGDTSSDTCAAGTDAGVGDGYQNNKHYRIRLCNVQGITVNSQIAGNLDKMLNSAKGAGFSFAGSSGFRSMESQIKLRSTNGCPDIYDSPSSTCRTPTARPGYSNHQMGLAIDFVCNGSLIRTHNSCFNWLAANGPSYKFYNFPKEPWHWSIDGR